MTCYPPEKGKNPPFFRSSIMIGAALLLAGMAIPATASAQQVVEIDYTAGRTIIDSEWRAMHSSPVMADWDSGRLYVRDAEEPDGIMVFSLETGEHLRTIQAPRGDGPFEFSQGWRSMALASDGGLHVSGGRRVITYDPSYQPTRSWTPRVPVAGAVCDIGGLPVVPTQRGALRYEDETIGPRAIADTLYHSSDRFRSVEAVASELQSMSLRAMFTRMICTNEMAIVVATYSTMHQLSPEFSRPVSSGADSIFTYHLDGSTERVIIPLGNVDEDENCTETIGLSGRTFEMPCESWAARMQPSLDDSGNLVLSSLDHRIAGVIIGMDTGCHALVRKDEDEDKHIRMVAVRGDSVLVFHADRDVRSGRPTIFPNNSVKASVHPVRRVEGEPCAGMLGVIRAMPRR